MDKGLVNFGAADTQISNRYFLVSKLSEAMIASNGDVSEQGEMGKILSIFLNFQEKRISKAEQKHLIIQTLKGAGIAASFAVGGYFIRHFAGQWFGWDKKAVELVGQENTPQGVVIKPEQLYPKDGGRVPFTEEAVKINGGAVIRPEQLYSKAENVKNIFELK